jgi:L-asparaginase
LRNENGPVISEVGLYFEYKLYRGTERPRLMQSILKPNYPQLVESGVHLKWSADLLPKVLLAKLHKNLDTNVAIIKMFPELAKLCLRRF